MNLRIFHTLMREPGLQQQPPEWKLFLELCSTYLKDNKIKNPIVVELGSGAGKQKKFWKQFFDAEYIGIDISDKESKPDILGNTHSPKTLVDLTRKLKGRSIDILFIDASHIYEDVKKDYELYSPLCDGVVALHDVETFRYTGRKSAQVWKFWDELRGGAYIGPVVTIFKRRRRGCQGGIGVIFKK